MEDKIQGQRVRSLQDCFKDWRQNAANGLRVERYLQKRQEESLQDFRCVAEWQNVMESYFVGGIKKWLEKFLEHKSSVLGSPKLLTSPNM